MVVFVENVNLRLNLRVGNVFGSGAVQHVHNNRDGNGNGSGGALSGAGLLRRILQCLVVDDGHALCHRGVGGELGV